MDAQSKNLPALINPRLGNKVFLAGELIGSAPNLDPSKIDQIAALPIGARVKLDPWSDRVELLKAKAIPLLSAREKMPFEVTPFMPYLTRYQNPGTPLPADAAKADMAKQQSQQQQQQRQTVSFALRISLQPESPARSPSPPGFFLSFISLILFPHASRPQPFTPARMPFRTAGVPPALLTPWHANFLPAEGNRRHPERRVGRRCLSSRSARDGRLAVEGSQLTNRHPCTYRASRVPFRSALTLGHSPKTSAPSAPA